VGDRLEVSYALPEPPPGQPPATALVVHLNSADDALPPRAQAIPIAAPAGEVSPPVRLDPSKRYQVTVSAGNDVGGGPTARATV